MAYIPTTGFNDKLGRERIYWFESGQVFWKDSTDSGSFTESANHWLGQRTKADLKVTKVNKSNWKKAAAAHANLDGLFCLMNTIAAEARREGKVEIAAGKSRAEAAQETADIINGWVELNSLR